MTSSDGFNEGDAKRRMRSRVLGRAASKLHGAIRAELGEEVQVSFIVTIKSKKEGYWEECSVNPEQVIRAVRGRRCVRKGCPERNGRS